MAAAIIRCRSIKSDTLAVLEAHRGKSGTPESAELVYVESRDRQQVKVLTNQGVKVLEANSPDASVFSEPGIDGITYRLREDAA